MGYTNYWKLGSKKEHFSKSLIGKVKKIFSTYEEQYNERLVECYESESKPFVDDTFIHFNGKGEDAYEDFFISLRDTESTNGFCKTARKKYDAAVKAVLMLLQSSGYLLEWAFDGETTEDEYKAGIALLTKAGFKYNKRMIPRG